MENAEIKLNTPFVYEDKTFSSFVLDFDKITGKVLEQAEKACRKAEIDISIIPAASQSYCARVGALILGLPAEAVASLPARAYVAIANKITGFLLKDSEEEEE